MKSRDELMQEIEMLRDRISKLSAASLRVSASLELDTVLSEIVESARSLIGTRYGVIATVGSSGQVEEVVSSGFTEEGHRQMLGWADGPRLFEHLRDLEGALRSADMHGYVRSLGLSRHPFLPKTALGTPMHHRGVNVGIFFLAGKAGGRKFSSEDEDVLVLFAAQAATAIANARTYRDEHRARADLEALVDTSPVGVAVFDARTGRLVLINREARRIVENLSPEGKSVEQLLEVMNCRCADGREFSLEEYPVAQVLSRATTLRASETVFEVPGGGSVTTLVNATPIHSEDGAVESVVIVVQDMAPLEELERSRAEFLSLVSHELRAPLTSIKGSAVTVLDASPAPDLAEILQFFRIIEEQADHMRGLISDLLDAGRIEAGTLSVAPEPEEVAELVDEARNTFLSGGGRHTILIDLEPDLPRVLADRNRMVQVLNNLFSNAARYSPQMLPIRISAVRDGVYVAISVSDEGRGIAPEQLPHLFRKHSRVGDSEGGIRGSGLGLSICKGLVEAHGGRIRAESGGAGMGARFTFTIPVAEETSSRATAGFGRRSARSPREGREETPILVVDDDPLTLRLVRDALSAAGYTPFVTGNPQEVSRLINAKKPQLVLLDLMLPGTDGIELMEAVPEMADLPVVFISGYGRDETIARALQKGAADYVVKPFSPTELVARVQAVLRRVAEPPEPFRLGELAIDYAGRRVAFAGNPLELTATEFDLLSVLSVNAGRVVTYDTLLRQVWSKREQGDPRLVRTYVKRLRRKLGDDADSSAYIVTVRAVGYRMASPGEV
ncbi:MAG: response regulator [Acidobacteriota bacterium]|nr:response regulator [Acidobacteriota bacterium]